MKNYLYDGTFDGYLTAIFYAYPEKEEVGIYKESIYSPSLLATSKVILSEADNQTEFIKAYYLSSPIIP